jgi:uncharacterized protein
MQDLTPRLTIGAQVIHSYGAEGFLIAGTRYAGSVLVSPQQTQRFEHALQDISAETLHEMLPADTEVLLIGTGAKHQQVPHALSAALKARGVSCDTMDTGAACRTYNILLSEGRLVSALLLRI